MRALAVRYATYILVHISFSFSGVARIRVWRNKTNKHAGCREASQMCYSTQNTHFALWLFGFCCVCPEKDRQEKPEDAELAGLLGVLGIDAYTHDQLVAKDEGEEASPSLLGVCLSWVFIFYFSEDWGQGGAGKRWGFPALQRWCYYPLSYTCSMEAYLFCTL